jgi:hypothetical protein
VDNETKPDAQSLLLEELEKLPEADRLKVVEKMVTDLRYGRYTQSKLTRIKLLLRSPGFGLAVLLGAIFPVLVYAGIVWIALKVE